MKKYLFYIIKEHVPEIFPDNNIFICKNDETIIFKCPCGCNEIIILSTLSDQKPKWTYSPPNSINPSINRIYGCKSHFSIQNGYVKFH